MAYMTILPQTCHHGDGEVHEGLYCRYHNHTIIQSYIRKAYEQH